MLVIALVVGLGMHLMGGAHKGKPPSPGEPVAVVPVVLQDVPVYIDALGTVTPTRSVTVVSQVDGILSSVEFKEGQHVSKGQVIARIDERRQEAPITLEAARPQIVRFLTYDQVKDLILKLRSKAKVETLIATPADVPGAPREPASAPPTASPVPGGAVPSALPPPSSEGPAAPPASAPPVPAKK